MEISQTLTNEESSIEGVWVIICPWYPGPSGLLRLGSPGQFVRFNFHNTRDTSLHLCPGARWWLSSLSCYWSNCLTSGFWLAKLTEYTPSLFFRSQNQLLGMFHRFFCCLILNNKRVERKSEESGPALHTTRIYLHKINCKSMRINPDYFSILVFNQLKFRMFTHELIFEYGEVSLSARWLLGVGPQWIISIIPSHLNIWSPFS